jgi:hypothetical protein
MFPYLELARTGELERRAAAAYELLGGRTLEGARESEGGGFAGAEAGNGA